MKIQLEIFNRLQDDGGPWGFIIYFGGFIVLSAILIVVLILFLKGCERSKKE